MQEHQRCPVYTRATALCEGSILANTGMCVCLTRYDIELGPHGVFPADVLFFGESPLIHAVHNLIDLHTFQITQEVIIINGFDNQLLGPVCVCVCVCVCTLISMT